MRTIKKNKHIMTSLYTALLLLTVMIPLASAGSAPPMLNDCAVSVAHLDVSCEGGEIVTDSFGGSCRQLICESGESLMQVLACDKPGYPVAEYYEIYRQGVEGTEVSEVCVGDACVGSNGFAMGGQFPICGETPGTDAYCGDGIVNQAWEECDGKDGLVEGYYCSNNCALIPIPTDDECIIDHRTQTQGGWGTGASGENPGAYRDANFDGAFPNGVRIGLESEYSALFETSSDVEAFLPQGGQAESFDQNYLNPTTANAGVLGGQALSLALSLGFDAYDSDFSGSDTPLAHLVVNNGVCLGMNVQEVMDEANLVLGGLGTLTPEEINDCLDLINNNFVDGTINKGYLECPQRNGEEEPACPLNPNHYDYVIEIYERIRTDKTESDSVTSKYPVSLMPGTYSVTLVGDDGYEKRVDATQPHEQYSLEFFKDGSIVGITSYTSDLEDYVEYASVIETVETDFVLSEGADKIRGVHAYYPHKSPNSLNVVCVGLKKKPVQDLTCEDAIKYGLLYGTIEDGEAKVYNDAWLPFEVSLVSYQMPSGLISDQVLYDYEIKTVGANSHTDLSVDVPECAYQIDLVCGRPLETNPEYGNRMIISEFGNEGNYCDLETDGTAIISIAPWFPQGKNYIFVCETDFEATSYSWYFGDGKHLLNIANDNVWHTYQNDGIYQVTCVATDGEYTASDSMLVKVGEPLILV